MLLKKWIKIEECDVENRRKRRNLKRFFTIFGNYIKNLEIDNSESENSLWDREKFFGEIISLCGQNNVKQFSLKNFSFTSEFTQRHLDFFASLKSLTLCNVTMESEDLMRILKSATELKSLKTYRCSINLFWTLGSVKSDQLESMDIRSHRY